MCSLRVCGQILLPIFLSIFLIQLLVSFSENGYSRVSRLRGKLRPKSTDKDGCSLKKSCQLCIEDRKDLEINKKQFSMKMCSLLENYASKTKQFFCMEKITVTPGKNFFYVKEEDKPFACFWCSEEQACKTFCLSRLGCQISSVFWLSCKVDMFGFLMLLLIAILLIALIWHCCIFQCYLQRVRRIDDGKDRSSRETRRKFL